MEKWMQMEFAAWYSFLVLCLRVLNWAVAVTMYSYLAAATENIVCLKIISLRLVI